MTIRALTAWKPIIPITESNGEEEIETRNCNYTDDERFPADHLAQLKIMKNVNLDTCDGVESFARTSYRVLHEHGGKPKYERTTVSLNFLQMSFDCSRVVDNTPDRLSVFAYENRYTRKDLFKIPYEFIRSITVTCRYCEATEEAAKNTLLVDVGMEKHCTDIVLDYLYEKTSVVAQKVLH